MKDVHPLPPAPLSDLEEKLQDNELDVVIMTTCEHDPCSRVRRETDRCRRCQVLV
jgi:hypothetical protein